MELVSRADWDARPPERTTALNFANVDKFIVHYSGASREQTIRSIQDYSMDVKGYSDIDYNYLVKDGLVYVGRGTNAGGHTLGNNSSSFGVCVVGMDGDATDADRVALIKLHRWLSSLVGRQLIKTHHRGVLGDSYTSCPGSQLEAWVEAGMPYPQEGGPDMFDEVDRGNLRATDERIREALILGKTYTDDDPAIGMVTPWIVEILTDIVSRLERIENSGPGSIVGKQFTATGTFTGKE